MSLPLLIYLRGDLDATELPTTEEDLSRGDMQDARRDELVARNAYLTIERRHLLRLCDDVLAGRIPLRVLQIIASYLVGSVHFGWDDDVVAEVLERWQEPNIWGAITPERIHADRVVLAS